MKNLLLLIPLVLLSVAGCAKPSSSTPSAALLHPTYTPYPTPKPLATWTLYPTYTPPPTFTPWPTYTPYPTYTPPKATSTPSPSATPKRKIGTRKNPVPLGEWVTVKKDDKVLRGRIAKVIKDQEAVKKRLRSDNMFNKVPAEGYKGILIYFVCEYVSGPEDETVSVSSSDFDFLCGDGKFYEAPFAVLNDEFGGTGYPGATFEGWLYRGCAVTNKPDFLIWKTSWLTGLGEGIWMALE
ncbi:MAG: hypothetical protein J7M05_03465 [Anaerolineae bacterium]|nr:hypothetical protein [Anaerolineae bacterium]